METTEPLYNYILQFISTYILPPETALPYYDNIIIVISMIVTLGIFWACFIRPFWWLFKYGLFGGSKKQRRLNNWKED